MDEVVLNTSQVLLLCDALLEHMDEIMKSCPIPGDLSENQMLAFRNRTLADLLAKIHLLRPDCRLLKETGEAKAVAWRVTPFWANDEEAILSIRLGARGANRN